MKIKKIIAAILSILAAGATMCLMAQEIIKMIETGLPIEQNNPNGVMCLFLIGANVTVVPWMIVNKDKALGAGIIVSGIVGALCLIYTGMVSILAGVELCYPVSYFVLAGMAGIVMWWVGNIVIQCADDRR